MNTKARTTSRSLRGIWHDMKRRCLDARHVSYPWYGAKGIGICDAWRDSFETFLTDVGPRPSKHHHLQLIERLKGYQPGNVRWGTQDSNQTNRLIIVNGETRSVASWARLARMSYSSLRARLKRGWSIERALSTPIDTKHSPPRRSSTEARP